MDELSEEKPQLGHQCNKRIKGKKKNNVVYRDGNITSHT